MTKNLFCTRWNAEAAAAMRRREQHNGPFELGSTSPFRAPRPRDAWVEPFLYGAATGIAGSYLPFVIMIIWRSF